MLCLDIFWSLVILTLSINFLMSLWAHLFDQSSISNTGLALVSKESLAFVSSISNTLSTRVALEKARQSVSQWSISGSGGISNRQVSPAGMLICIRISVFNFNSRAYLYLTSAGIVRSCLMCPAVCWLAVDGSSFWCFIWQKRSTMTRVGCPVQHSLMGIRTFWRGCELSLCLALCPGGMLELLAIIVRSGLEGGRCCGGWWRWSWMVLAWVSKQFGGGSAVLEGGDEVYRLQCSSYTVYWEYHTARIRCAWDNA